MLINVTHAMLYISIMIGASCSSWWTCRWSAKNVSLVSLVIYISILLDKADKELRACNEGAPK